MDGIKTIFLCHDLQESSEARVNYLEHAGYRVCVFSDAQELANALSVETPSCIILDVLLEGANGFSLAEGIDREFPARTFPMVICSRLYRARSFREEASRCGAAAYLLMPLSLEEFLRQIHHVIQNYKAGGGGGGLELAA